MNGPNWWRGHYTCGNDDGVATSYVADLDTTLFLARWAERELPIATMPLNTSSEPLVTAAVNTSLQPPAVGSAQTPTPREDVIP